ncbi:hypothetical protein [Maribacter forsetii]|uniref:hypothetical protein n=1 Tax=Maribacter forsetii TaxID=444515 RepID=UPI000563EDBD|nr:hypothetical protein [Maribacter forsetii]
MKKYILIFTITFFQTISFFGQNLNGIYSWTARMKTPTSDLAIIEIEITSDSTYVQTAYRGFKVDIDNKETKWEKFIKKGKIRKEGVYHIIAETGKPKSSHKVEIKKNKLLFDIIEMDDGKARVIKGGIEYKKVNR